MRTSTRSLSPVSLLVTVSERQSPGTLNMALLRGPELACMGLLEFKRVISRMLKVLLLRQMSG